MQERMLFYVSISPLRLGGVLTPCKSLLNVSSESNIYILLYCETILTIKGRCGAQSQNLLNMVRRRRRFGAYDHLMSLPPP